MWIFTLFQANLVVKLTFSKFFGGGEMLTAEEKLKMLKSAMQGWLSKL